MSVGTTNIFGYSYRQCAACLGASAWRRELLPRRGPYSMAPATHVSRARHCPARPTVSKPFSIIASSVHGARVGLGPRPWIPTRAFARADFCVTWTGLRFGSATLPPLTIRGTCLHSSDDACNHPRIALLPRSLIRETWLKDFFGDLAICQMNGLGGLVIAAMKASICGLSPATGV